MKDKKTYTERDYIPSKGNWCHPKPDDSVLPAEVWLKLNGYDFAKVLNIIAAMEDYAEHYHEQKTIIERKV